VGELPAGEPALSLIVPFGAEIGWEFDGGPYVRSEGGSAFQVYPEFGAEPVDYQVDTVVALFAASRSAGYQDGNGVDVPTFDVVGSGRLVVFHAGVAVEGTWTRASQDEPYVFLGLDGTEIGLPEGRTHVMIVPRELDITY
jgi:hypothetical protein